MSMSSNELRSAVEAETAHFCDTEQTLQVSKGTLGRPRNDVRQHVRISNCGVATALVQHNLKEHYDVTTSRLFGEAPLAPRTRFGRIFGHVVLRTEDTLIDPTYGQLFSYVGVDLSSPHMKDFVHPGPLALAIDLENPDATLEPLIDDLHEAASVKTGSLDAYAPLRDQGRQAIRAVIYDIYNLEHYVPYEVEAHHPSFEYIQALKQISAEIRGPSHPDCNITLPAKIKTALGGLFNSLGGRG